MRSVYIFISLFKYCYFILFFYNFYSKSFFCICKKKFILKFYFILNLLNNVWNQLLLNIVTGSAFLFAYCPQLLIHIFQLQWNTIFEKVPNILKSHHICTCGGYFENFLTYGLFKMVKFNILNIYRNIFVEVVKIIINKITIWLPYERDITFLRTDNMSK